MLYGSHHHLLSSPFPLLLELPSLLFSLFFFPLPSPHLSLPPLFIVPSVRLGRCLHRRFYLLNTALVVTLFEDVQLIIARFLETPAFLADQQAQELPVSSSRG